MDSELQLHSTHVVGVFEQRTSLENPNVNLQDPALWGAVFGDTYTTASGIEVTHESALRNAAVWQAISLISGDLAKLPLDRYRRLPKLGDSAREIDRGHPTQRLVRRRPNAEMNSIKFWRRFWVFALLYNNSYAFIDRDGTGQPIGLYPLLPDRTGPVRRGGKLYYETEVSGYGMPVPVDAEDVLHVEGIGINNLEGFDLIQAARESVALALANEKFASKFFKHGGRIGGVLEISSLADKTSRDKTEEGFRKMYEGADNPFKVMVLRDNHKFHAAQTSPKDSQMIEASEQQVRQIARWFNLSPSKLGLSDSVSYNSKAEDNQAYLDSTLSIWLEQLAAECNTKLLNENEQDSCFFEHNTAALLKMDLLQRYQAYQIGISSRIVNPNECRSKENMLPYEGGDEYVNPNTLQGGTPPKAEETETDDDEPNRAVVISILGTKARDKAKRTKALLEWVDSGFARDKAAWKKEHGQRAPDKIMEEVRAGLAAILETTHESELCQKVDELFRNLEK